MFTVVGIKSIVSKKDSRRFVELHLLTDDRFVSGKRCEVVFVPVDNVSGIESLSLDSTVRVFYNRYGRVDSVEVL